MNRSSKAGRRAFVGSLALALCGCHPSSSGRPTKSVAPSPSPTPSPTPSPSSVDPNLVALGQALFHDKILSGNKNISCATCHGVVGASGDGLPVSLGQGGSGTGPTRTIGTGKMIGRNALALFNNDVTPQSSTFVNAVGGVGGPPVLTAQPQVLNATAAAAPMMAGGTSSAPGAAAAQAFTTQANLPTMAPGDPGGSQYGGASESFFWDGRVQFNPFQTPEPLLDNPTDPDLIAMRATLDSPLATQALFPVTVVEEMRGNPGENELASATTNLGVWKGLMLRLVGNSSQPGTGIDGYRTLFQAAYPGVALDDLNFAHATRAIAAFIGQTFVAMDTPFDTFVAGDTTAMSANAQNGMSLFFGTANCGACHGGVHFSDFADHALAVPQVGPGRDEPSEDRGLALTTLDLNDNYKFRTPSLRNVELTGPYMHDGAYTTLEGAIQHHLDPATALKNYDPTQLPASFAATLDTDAARNAARIAAIDPIITSNQATTSAISASDVSDLVAFLKTLTDSKSVQRIQAAKPAAVPSGLTID